MILNIYCLDLPFEINKSKWSDHMADNKEEFKTLLLSVYNKGNEGATMKELMSLLESELAKLNSTVGQRIR